MTERAAPPDDERVATTAIAPEDLVVVPRGELVLRLHPLAGAHPRAWDEMRAWGPSRAWFDHHPLPRRVHPTRRIAYLATGRTALACALAETFQAGTTIGPIDRGRFRMQMTAFRLAHDIQLLDLEGGWLTRAGGNQAVLTGPRGTARAWARGIYRHHVTVDGLLYRSSVWGPGRCIALWERGAHAIPPHPEATAPLVDPGLYTALAAAADDLGVPLV